MMLYFVGHPLAKALFFGTLVVWVAIELRQGLRRRTGATNRDRGSRLVLGLCWLGGILMAALARSRLSAAAFPEGAVTFGVGLSVIWAGVGLRWWSFRTLGRYFTFEVMTSSDQPVIAAGPYRVLRHPSYAGLLLIFAGIGILSANWLSLAALILLPLLGLLNRIRVEEAALTATLGDAYRSYAAGRKRLIPCLW